ncbi:protein CANDIDATE G-PROTEIN COUPLED RECEPTOR 7-like [Eucalyptus grandis]|uniref:protein CANDIDATE G-PROTEIN COUPLED RECEPTOR 7-like n=1 Tax=Eucalyptus grandis TaxID=71139 RepID=UPI00192EED3D|nr:protein CANDIDATE G-PROTEIN COUPLED RECEPTOR 7-like [Eucalyptus grandis]
MAKLHYALLLLISLISHSNADIKTLSLTSDPRPIILLHKFAFTYLGRVTISASDVSVISLLRRTNSSRLGFVLLSEEAHFQVLLKFQQNPIFCILDSPYAVDLFNFLDLSPPPHSYFNKTYAVTYPSGYYSLYFANCNPEVRVSMNIHAEFYNLDLDGSKNYLSHGQSTLIPLFFAFSLAYFFVLVLWVYYCRCNKESTNRVHRLLNGLIMAKTLSLIYAGLDKYSVKLTGSPHGWEISFEVLRVLSSLIIAALIIIGFSFFKQFLPEKSAKVWIIPIALQVLSNLAFPFAVMMGDTGPWVVLGLAFLDMICTCTIVVTVGRSIWLLKEAAKTDEKVAMRLAKIKKFALVYALAIGYFYVVPMVALVLRSFIAPRYEWVSNAVQEGANLTIYVVTLRMFRPVNDYTILDAQDEKEETMAVAYEESEV